MSAPKDQRYRRLIEHLRRARGTDFSFYKPTSLQRRLDKRMNEVGIDSPDDYTDFLEVHPEEFGPLFDTILINVTSFFRDPQTWDFVASTIIPTIVEQAVDRPIRVWVPGCATGEEAYTIAILLAEATGEDAFSENVKIFATDLDEAALAIGRQAAYPDTSLKDIPADLRERYLGDRRDGARVFRSELRRNLIFGPHDLTRDAPIRHVDLVSCRNTLMYFNAEAQGMIAARLHFALRDNGFLLLGRSEGLSSHGDLFRPVSMPHRVFTKAPVSVRDRLLRLARPPGDDTSPVTVGDILPAESALDALSDGLLIVDINDILINANQGARTMFGLVPGDVGRPFADLEVSYRPVELRSLIDQCRNTQQRLKGPEVERHLPDRSTQFLDVELIPLGSGDRLVGTLVVFTDITEMRKAGEEHLRFRNELEAAYEELQSTNEELETTNEELQSTVEELETTNEELQSTNEELETINEEMQSTNEELRTLNDELRLRTEELDEANAFLRSILGGIESAVIVVDRTAAIMAWSSHAEELWGLRTDEVTGTSLYGLDIGFPVGKLRKPIGQVIEGIPTEPLRLEATSRRGKTIQTRIAFTPLLTSDNHVRGVIVMMEEDGHGRSR